MPHLDDATLNEYLDDALPAPARAEAAAHLAGCPACDRRLQALRSLFAALEALPDTLPPRDLSAVVVARLSQPPALRPAWRRVLALQAAAAVALLAVSLPLTLGAAEMSWLTGNLPWSDWGLVLATAPALNVLNMDWLAMGSAAAQWASPLAAAGPLNALNMNWAAMGSAAAQWASPLLAATSSRELGVLIVAAGALGLVGNGLLLRSAFLLRRRS